MKVKAVVIHWDDGPVKSIESLKSWMRKNTSNFYHRFVKGDEISYGMSTAEKAYHCGGNLYTAEAINYFDQYCPDWDHRDSPHTNSPNNCTIGVCMLHDFEDGGYSNDTIYTGAKLAGQLLKYYGLGLDGLWTHHMITGKNCPKAFVENPEQWAIFKDIVRRYL